MNHFYPIRLELRRSFKSIKQNPEAIKEIIDELDHIKFKQNLPLHIPQKKKVKRQQMCWDI